MTIPLAVLIVEDSENDALLIVRLLEKAGYAVVFEQIETAAQMRTALEKRAWDMVISDYSLPQFGGRAALMLLKAKQLDIPFIVVSGTIGEENAVALMKAGAHDYLTKENLARLAPTVARELEQAQDRRERKQARDALRESEERFRFVLNNSRDAAYRRNLQTDRYDYMSPVIEQVLGWSAEEMNQMGIETVLTHVHPEDVAAIVEEMERTDNLCRAIGRATGMLEYRFCSKKGEYRWVGDTITVLADADGRLLYRLGIIRDISERKQAEDALRESEALNQAILKNSPIGISVRSRTGQLLSANDAWKKLWAIPEPDVQADATRERPTLTFNERDTYLKSHTDEVRRVYEQGGHLHLPELKTASSRAGAAKWISQHFYAIPDAQGQVARVVILTEDITGRKLAQEKIQESEERLAAVMEGSQLGYSDWNIQTGEIRRNERWAGMLGYTLKEIETNYLQWEDLMHPEDLASARQSLQDHLDGTTPVHRDEYRLRAKDGSYRWILDQGKIIACDPQGRPLRMTATHTDITERKQAEDQLRQLSRAVEHSPSTIVITDRRGNIEYVNPKFTALTGYILNEVRGRNPQILESGQTPPRVYRELWQAILRGQEWRGELLNRKKNGDLFWASVSISAISDSSGKISHFVAVNEDVTARKEADQKIQLLNLELENLAMTDYLTNLYNRRYFMQRGEQEFRRAKRSQRPLSAMMIDIDKFKNVNDTYGHESGDTVLKQVAARLKNNLREIDLLGRVGGEEFAVLLPETSLREASISAERVRQAIQNEFFELPGGSLTISTTICIGVAVVTDKISDIDDLLRNADAALYQAKNSGRNRVITYQENSSQPSDLAFD